MKQLEQDYQGKIDSGHAPLIPGLVLPVSIGEINKDLGDLDMSNPKTQTSNLIRVVEHLSKTVARQKSEAQFLKKNAPSNVRYMDLVKECKALKKTRDEMQAVLDSRANQDKQQAKYIPIHFNYPLRRLEAENGKLCRQAKQSSKEAATRARQFETLRVENAGLKKEVEALGQTLTGLGYTPGESDAQTRENTRRNSISHADCSRDLSELVRNFSLLMQYRKRG